jgi:hypothetical protein
MSDPPALHQPRPFYAPCKRSISRLACSPHLCRWYLWAVAQLDLGSIGGGGIDDDALGTFDEVAQRTRRPLPRHSDAAHLRRRNSALQWLITSRLLFALRRKTTRHSGRPNRGWTPLPTCRSSLSRWRKAGGTRARPMAHLRALSGSEPARIGPANRLPSSVQQYMRSPDLSDVPSSTDRVLARLLCSSSSASALFRFRLWLMKSGKLPMYCAHTLAPACPSRSFYLPKRASVIAHGSESIVFTSDVEESEQRLTSVQLPARCGTFQTAAPRSSDEPAPGPQLGLGCDL